MKRAAQDTYKSLLLYILLYFCREMSCQAEIMESLLYQKKADGQKWHITSVNFKDVKHQSFSEKSSDACYAFFKTYSFFETLHFSLHWGKSFLKPISAEALLKT